MYKKTNNLCIKAFTIFLLSIGITACNPTSKGNKSMDESEPITGYERSLKFEIGQVKLDVPYGYLFDYSQERGKFWPTDNNKVKVIDNLTITVADKTFLKPYNQETKELFLKKVDGQENNGIRILIRPFNECTKINVDSSIRVATGADFRQVASRYKDYLAYENTIENAAYTYRAKYYKKVETVNTVIINIDRHTNLPINKYSGLVTRCSQNLFLQYYINFNNYNSPPTLDEVIDINNSIDQLINTFVVNNVSNL